MSSWRQPPFEVSRCNKQVLSPRSHLLQVVSEALDIPQQQEYQDRGIGRHDDEEDAILPPEVVSVSNFQHSKTVVSASDGQVSNGFVLHGQNLPYVFEEATDPSGARKKSSKILPVCAVCGKRFVCVTTMKRHLVTHTGEKPFSCKICGKHYTQKGNLRVHERTHRNDRPFECQICHQKFYRKEPMQKHQWRQHGIVHLKSGRTSTSSGSGEENSAVSIPRNYTALVKADPDPGTKSNKIQDLDQHSAVPKPIKLSYETTAENLVNNAKTTPKKPTTTKIIHEIQTNNAETSPIKLKMKMAYHQHLIDSHNAPLHSAMQEQEDEEEHLIKEQCKIMEKSTSKWMTSMDQDPKPLDLSSKSSLSDHNQPSLLPTINTNNFTIPKQKHITTTVTTNVPTIQMSDSQRTLSKLLQNFTTKSNSNPANATGTPESPRKVSLHMSVNNRSKLLHGLFQSETHTRAI